MAVQAAIFEKRSFKAPDETRPFDKGQVEVLAFAGSTIGKITLQPGWRWSESIKPIAKTEYCEEAHFNYVLSGRLHIQTQDGRSLEMGPGDVMKVTEKHDAWVVGEEPFVALEFTAARSYAKR
ncbi:MAG TPA: cupin domain-containing protein [Pantanalinema sp.]